MNRVLALVMAGGLGERLKPLTIERSKAAVPFGAKFRIIDFTLSNCINSGVRQIYVLTQYRSGSLQQHIQEGWGISSSGLGDYIYSVPAQQKVGVDWYRGTADAVRQNLDLLRGKDVNHVLILAGDHVYKMDYSQMLDYHKKRNAGLTISAVRVRKEQASGRLGVLSVDSDYQVLGFEEKPDQPKTIAGAPEFCLASMGIYIFKVEALRDALQGIEADFGKEVIPRMTSKEHDVFAYDYEKENSIEDYAIEVSDGQRRKILVSRARDSSYWRDIGTIESYYDASMDLVGVDPIFNLYGEKWLIRNFQKPLPPSKFVLGGSATDSMVSDGCIISGGRVGYSILSPGVIVERDAVVEMSIIFNDVIIEPHARVRRAIIDKECRIRSGVSLGYNIETDKKAGCRVTDTGIVIVPRGAEIGRG